MLRVRIAVAIVLVACSMLVDLGCADGQLQTRVDFLTVSTPTLLQRAFKDGVQHIVLTEHVSTVTAQREVEGQDDSLDDAVLIPRASTRSLVVRE
jgi:hypothetical protein